MVPFVGIMHASCSTGESAYGLTASPWVRHAARRSGRSIHVPGLPVKIAASGNPACRSRITCASSSANSPGVETALTSSICTAHRPLPWLTAVYGKTCFWPETAIHATHGPSGGSHSTSATARMSARLVRCTAGGVPKAHFG